jgi:hypothetical protein
MKVSMQLTLDGLLRALRWRAHNMAEEIALSRDAADRDQGARPARRKKRFRIGGSSR